MKNPFIRYNNRNNKYAHLFNTLAFTHGPVSNTTFPLGLELFDGLEYFGKSSKMYDMRTENSVNFKFYKRMIRTLYYEMRLSSNPKTVQNFEQPTLGLFLPPV